MSGKQRRLRVKKAISSDEEHEDDAVPELQRDKLEETKILQRQRKRSTGLDANELAFGTGNGQAGPDDSNAVALPAELMGSYVRASNASSLSGPGAGGGDDDPHMRKFIEEQLAKRLGRKPGAEGDGAEGGAGGAEAKRRKLEEELYAIPDMKASTTLGATDGSVPGMLTGITEVPLSKEVRLAKIEETEALKRQLLARKQARGYGGRGGRGRPLGASADLYEDALAEAAAGPLQVKRSDFAMSFGRSGRGGGGGGQWAEDPLERAEQRAQKERRNKYLADPNLPPEAKDSVFKHRH